jgi:hypothetical protein
VIRIRNTAAHTLLAPIALILTLLISFLPLHNLTHLTNYIYSALNDKKYCIWLFLDLKKAFDVCSHSILRKKLRKYGIHGTKRDWFASYLKDRKQHIDIEGNLSSASTFNIYVIQGSILGPILFLITFMTYTMLLTFLNLCLPMTQLPSL